MIRCVRMWTGEDGDSLFEEGWVDLSRGTRGDAIGEPVPVVGLSFQETRSGGSYEWHQDPVPRFVITLSGTLEFQNEVRWMITGTDIDYGALTHLLVSQLQAQPGFSVHYKHKVTDLAGSITAAGASRWRISIPTTRRP